MMNRRFGYSLVLAICLTFGLSSGANSGAATKAGSNGLVMPHPEPWINASTGDLSKDLAKATSEGKILTVFWEQVFCHYCKQMHEVNLKKPDILNYIKQNFYAVQLDMRGEGKVAGFDNETMSELKLAQRSNVRGTPTIIFYTPSGGEVARMPGFGQPAVFKKVFEFVRLEAYKNHSMIEWITAQFQKEAEG